MPKKFNGTSNDDTINGSWWDDIISGLDGDDTLFGDGGKDQLFGGIGNDTLNGGNGDDFLMGGADADSLQGGSGIDTASYSRSSGAVKVWLEDGVAHGSEAEGDTLSSIENVTGSVYDDWLFGSAVTNHLVGSGGDDWIWGEGGEDILDGGSGNDTFHGGQGGDDLDGGAGSDEANYIDSPSGVFVDLLTGTGHFGFAEGDTLWSIENLYGSNHDDTLIGNFADNTLTGRRGTDVLIGGDGADTFAFGFRPWPSKPADDGMGAAADTVEDFNALQGDKIDLTAVGLKLAGSPPKIVDWTICTFIGESDFTGLEGEVRYEHIGTNTWISCDRDGNASADFQIKCAGTINFTANDFLL
jgi:Ca2+-binding RTX toxin-like protein